MRDVLEAMHDYPDEALGLFSFDSDCLVIVRCI